MINYNLFMDGMRIPDPLPKKEIQELFEKMKLGDKEAREKIILHNMRLVMNEVRTTFVNTNYDKEELVAVGLIGLTKSVDKFDPSRGLAFNTFAVTVIDNEIRMFMRRENKHNNDISILTASTHDAEDNELTIEEQLFDESVNIEEDYIYNDELKRCVKLLQILPERDRKMVMLYLGFYNDKRYTHGEIAKLFSLSRSFVSKTINKSLKKLKKYSEHQEVYFKLFNKGTQDTPDQDKSSQKRYDKTK